MMNVNVLIVGGCVTEQHNIPFDKLYHQILKQSVKNTSYIDLNINIIRYEKFTTCYDKIKKYLQNNPVDILLFHIRSEQYLRLAKLYYKFADADGKIKHSLNVPLFKISNPEKYDLQLQQRQFCFTDTNTEPSAEKKKFFHKFLVSMNYHLGFLTGNTYHALKSYYNLVSRVNDYCILNHIKIIVIGPVPRPHTEIENFLTAKLNTFMINSIDTKKITYLNCFGKFLESSEQLFFENGIHVNEKGHQKISGIIINEFEKFFMKKYFVLKNY